MDMPVSSDIPDAFDAHGQARRFEAQSGAHGALDRRHVLHQPFPSCFGGTFESLLKKLDDAGECGAPM
jgi:hypothetical protein